MANKHLKLPRPKTVEALTTAERELCGVIMLPHGQFALVDRDQLMELSKYDWFMHSGGYVVRWSFNGSDRKLIFMHRAILCPADGVDVDHRNRNKRDNRKCNLRVCNDSQNAGNALKHFRPNSTSKFKGVSKQGRQWRVWVCENNMRYLFGKFQTEIEAALAYNIWAKKHFGEFAILNEV